ncbi:hypothetical protein RHMOL_Rhmol10G0201300 [Rhododendron molle]|uniref:Uncharacterized protein n=1 Tax=Rhododendron molle TaxID=49168 RepID=A0ACC0M404_RHOML|nr:hypothetical protein RHMOL_Rhmol10G0201300 [Rhododendron molle]
MHQREMLYLEMTTEEWCTFMSEISPQEIVWRHEALDIPDMALNSAGFERMVFAGLSCSHSTSQAVSFGSWG